MPTTHDRFDALSAQVARGHLSAQLRAVLGDRLQKRSDFLLTKAIGEWHGQTLTGENARATIAALAELRALAADLDRDVLSGAQAHERLTSPSPNGTATEDR
jgi:hypothetical protein